jgi:hypothetical protein
MQARLSLKHFEAGPALFIAKSNNDAALASLFDRRPTDLLLVALCGRWLFELLDELS